MTAHCADLSVDLSAVRAVDLPAVGGKAANLGELLGAGFDVPGGFVVTTTAYRQAARGALSADEIRDIPPPPEVAAAITQAYAALGGGAVAVRSSATAEDLPGATFAGQQDTYLDVEGAEAVLTAVRDCWASLWSERAVAYRVRLGIDPADVAMGVVVQRMVPADTAGVMFTADPVTGARDRVVINASEGLGEAVVSGAVTPEQLVVTSDGRVVERSRGRGERSRSAIVLTDADAAALARTGRLIAAHFGSPQDVEWACHAGRFRIVQSRAMTALPPAPIRLNRFQRFAGPVLVELLPRRPYPMELTAWILPTLGRHVDEMLDGMAGVQVGLRDALPARDAIVQEFVPPSPHATRCTPVRLASTVRRGLRGAAQDWAGDPRLRLYRDGVAALDALDLPRLSWHELTAVPGRAARLVDLVTALRVAYLPAGFVALARLLAATRLTGSPELAHRLIGGAPTMTTAANRALADLARDAALIPTLGDPLAAGKYERVRAEARSQPEVLEWWGELERFLATYGHRETTSLLLVRDPCWRDSPDTVLGLVQALLPDAAALDTGPDLPAATPGRLPPKWIRRLADRAAAGVACREDTHFELTRTMPPVRRAIIEAGRRLAAAGDLADPEDVWLLTLDELRTLAPGAGGEATTNTPRAIAARRSAAYAELASTPLIATTTLYPHRAGSASALALGTPGGGGRATGRVRIVRSPDGFGTLRAGEVLVCATTNPSWTPLFQRAVGVVVDHGGIGSHAAIVAREYGIPAVLGTGNGTTALVDGQLVSVDGDLGEVTPAPWTPGQP
ncbi:PEP/pyruvate-binding domain-containing protein [Intrasporangium sp.]|uniref:PEP/pyruvate-binding domain-containing protein n=1 Tax=Intrasporangium sp. TaxID=1925024 RepID=UPI003221C6EB